MAAFAPQGVVRPHTSRTCRVRPGSCTGYLLAGLVGLCTFIGLSLCSSPAASAEPFCEEQHPSACHPGYEISGRFGPTELRPGSYGLLVLYVFNVGGGPISGSPVLVDRLPKGLEAVSEMPGGPEATATQESGGCSGAVEVRCALSGLGPLAGPDILEIPVFVSPEAEVLSAGEAPVDLVSVSGGGALGVARSRVPVSYGSGTAPFAFASADAWLSNVDGTTDTQAGSHPYSFTVTFAMNSRGAGGGKEAPTVGEMHALNVNLPPGLVGEPGATPKCHPPAV